MKTTFYFFLLFSTAAFAQLVPGFHGDMGYVYENFSQTAEFDHIIWSPQDSRPVRIDSLSSKPSQCWHKPGTFSYSIQRDIVHNKGLVTVSQPYSTYETFGFHFGKNPNGSQKILDASKGNALLRFTFSNTSEYSVNVYVTLQDSTSKIANAVGTHKDIDGWQDMLVKFNIPSGYTYTDSVDFNADAFNIQYKDTTSTCGPFGYSGVDTTFDLRILRYKRQYHSSRCV